MRLIIAYSKIKKRNLVLINNDTHQRETVSERPIRPPLKLCVSILDIFHLTVVSILTHKIVFVIWSVRKYVVFVDNCFFKVFENISMEW